MSNGDGGLTRREFTGKLGAAGGLATSLAGGLFHRGDEAAAAGPELANAQWFARSVKDEFFEPPVVRSVNGDLKTELRVRVVPNKIGADDVKLRSYNGGLVGPTLRARPGDTLRIRLVNQLEWKGTGHVHEGHTEYHFNATNLHTHGLHVSPSGCSDNVLITVLPEGADAALANETTFIGSFEYCIHIPKVHLPGTHWYHAHLHGSTAVQLASGMAGALIIEGDIDEVPEIKAARERLFVFQQIAYEAPKDGNPGIVDSDGLVPFDLIDRWYEPSDQPGGQRLFTTINGIVPVIRMRQGALERWRWLHAGIFETLNVDVVACSTAYDPSATSITQFCPNAGTAPASPDIEFYQVARDGLTLGTRNRIAAAPLSPTLGPGNRMDLLVKALKPGTFILRKNLERDLVLNSRARLAANLRTMARTAAIANVRDAPYALAVIVVEPDAGNADVPTAATMAGLARPKSLAGESIAKTQVIKLNFGCSGDQGCVGNRTFKPDMFPRTLQLGDVDEWLLKGDDVHPFHIHVNPFMVVKVDEAPVEPFWRDALLLKADQQHEPRSVVMRTKYEHFTGRFVLHCHNLVHEDMGMMELVEIVPRAEGALGGLVYYQFDNEPTTPWSFLDEQGAAVGNAAFKGRTVLLHLWSPDCSGCENELASLQSLLRGLDRSKFSVAAVAQGQDVAAARAFYDRHTIADLAVFVDPPRQLSTLFAAPSLPATVLVDKVGHARAYHFGPAQWDADVSKSVVRYFMDS